MKNNIKGFTLLELLAVLVIMATIAIIAIPIFMNKSDEAKIQAHKSNIREITNAAQRYEWENGQPPTGVGSDYYNFVDENNILVTSKHLQGPVSSPYGQWKKK